MGKRKTTSEIKANSIKGNGNRVIINHAPPAPPMDYAPVFDILQSKDAEIKQLENEIQLLRYHIETQAQELARLRQHISNKDSYFTSLLFKRAEQTNPCT